MRVSRKLNSTMSFSISASGIVVSLTRRILLFLPHAPWVSPSPCKLNGLHAGDGSGVLRHSLFRAQAADPQAELAPWRLLEGRPGPPCEFPPLIDKPLDVNVGIA